MDPIHPTNTQNLLTLQEAAQKLGVSIDIMLQWNEINILKPTLTYSGFIGYTHEQIDKFLQIRQSQTPPSTQPYIPPTITVPSTPQQTVISQPMQPQMTQDIPQLVRQTKRSPYIFPSLAILSLLLTIFALTQQDKIESLLSYYEKPFTSTRVLGTQTSTVQVAVTSPAPIGLPSEGTSSKNLQVEGQNILTNNVSNAFSEKKTASSTAISNQKGKVIASAKVTNALQKQIQTTTAPQKNSLQENAEMQEVTTLASVKQKAEKPINSPGSALDTRGNILGDTKPNTLASLGGVGMIDDSSSQQNTMNTRNQLLLLGMLAAGSLLLTLRKPRGRSQVAKLAVPLQKVLEVGQKMDGTVVLYFQDKAYKVSKPELYSDSDQFIERLMKLSTPSSQEIEYDSLRDGQIRMAAPLSRLVTRLGFVGMKRDLFFPRTSKHRVLFRKYITSDDLAAMHTTIEEVLSDLHPIT